MTTPGIDYMGTVTTADGNKTCEYWNNTALPSFYFPTIFNINNILYGQNTSNSNRCRNVDNNSAGPWCYDKKGKLSRCTIPRCGKVFYDHICIYN